MDMRAMMWVLLSRLLFRVNDYGVNGGCRTKSNFLLWAIRNGNGRIGQKGSLEGKHLYREGHQRSGDLFIFMIWP